MIKGLNVYIILKIMLVLAFLTNIICCIIWGLGETIEPIIFMNSLLILSFSLILNAYLATNKIGFERWTKIGLIASVISFVIGLLILNNIISFRKYWHLALALSALSLMGGGIFQLISSNEKSSLKQFKYLLGILTVTLGVALTLAFVLKISNDKFYTVLFWLLLVQTTLTLVYFIYPVIRRR